MSGTRRTLAALAVLLVLGSCNTKLEKPPVEVTYRQSLVGAGKILQVKNQTNVPLREVEISIRSESGEVAYKEAEIPGYEVLEVGWKKLGGYEIPEGATVEVRAAGYLLPVNARVGAPADGENGSS